MCNNNRIVARVVAAVLCALVVIHLHEVHVQIKAIKADSRASKIVEPKQAIINYEMVETDVVKKYSRNRKVVLLGPHDRFNFGDILFDKVVSKLLMTRAGYSSDEILRGGIISVDMTKYGGAPTVLSMRVIQDLSQSAKEPYDIIFTGGEAMGCDHTCALTMMTNDKHRAQARREKINGCGYLFPKQLLLPSPENNPNNLTNYAVANSLGGKAASACKEAVNTADYVAYRDKGPLLYPDSAVMTKELYSNEIEKAAMEVLAELQFANDQKFVVVQHKRTLGGKGYEIKMALVLDQVARGMNATVVFFAAGTAPGHDWFPVYDTIKSFMKEDAVVYRGENVWKVVGLVSKASAVLSTSLHVRIMAFIYFKPRITWCNKNTKHARFISLWDDASAPCVYAKNLNTTWGILQSHYLSEPDQAKNTTAAKYNKTVGLYLESFHNYSGLLRPPIEA